ncbi:hypothetical protein CCACVL1_05112 [Corchorus capsularis]|uniref:Uncharacterized protein n=1 Tax=Corchorus capsularis TaxID=210143 RepID=A0A1R3JMF7_COCAP|nr:hypothetical protein CCACVL1_05112 [Corchorus capsularis]
MAATMARYRFLMLTRQLPKMRDIHRLKSQSVHVVSFPQTQPICLLSTNIPNPKLHSSCAAGGGDGKNGFGRSGGDRVEGGGEGDGKSNSKGFRIMGTVFLRGWRDRVAADPQFPFKVKMEQFVGVSGCVVGDMASRPNFGLNELDFVFSTLIVGSILNFTLMYPLAPTASSSSTSSSRLPSIFASCPRSHMFEPGAYTLMNRFGTFFLKGTVFAAVGFVAGLVGTTISNGLIKMRNKMDPNFETPNKPPPTLLNALTWAIHMGFSSNLRYQTLNGIEFLLAKGSVSPLVFKSSVVVLRCLNNILGGMSFVILARMTGSQSSGGGKSERVEVVAAAEKEKLLDGGDNTNQSTFK